MIDRLTSLHKTLCQAVGILAGAIARGKVTKRMLLEVGELLDQAQAVLKSE